MAIGKYLLIYYIILGQSFIIMLNTNLTLWYPCYSLNFHKIKLNVHSCCAFLTDFTCLLTLTRCQSTIVENFRSFYITFDQFVNDFDDSFHIQITQNLPWCRLAHNISIITMQASVNDCKFIIRWHTRFQIVIFTLKTRVKQYVQIISII